MAIEVMIGQNVAAARLFDLCRAGHFRVVPVGVSIGVRSNEK